MGSLRPSFLGLFALRSIVTLIDNMCNKNILWAPLGGEKERTLFHRFKNITTGE